METKRHHLLVVLILVSNLVLVFFLQHGTYDSGDSLMHYLQSRAALKHPHYFLNHWAKPVFILLSSPFTALGWHGMQIFQILCVSFASVGVYQLSGKGTSGLSVMVLLLTSTNFWLAQSSGLTEPLFAAVLIWSIVLVNQNRFKVGYLLFSFLPFIRSEGWLLIPVFFLYELFQNRGKLSYWLVAGSVIYGCVGWFFLGDFLWFIHQNPYQGNEVKYGAGNLSHFVNQWYYTVGTVVCIVGALGISVRWTKPSIRFTTSEKVSFLLIAGSFFSILIMHSIFWYFGLFHSLGMPRVLLIVVPVFAVMAGWFTNFWKSINARQTWIKYIPVAFSILAVLFQFTGNPASIVRQDLHLSNHQVTMREAIQHCSPKGLIYFSSPFVPFLLDLDIDNTQTNLEMRNIHDGTPLKISTIYWDTYFAKTNAEVDTTEVVRALGEKGKKCVQEKTDDGEDVIVWYFQP